MENADVMLVFLINIYITREIPSVTALLLLKMKEDIFFMTLSIDGEKLFICTLS